MTLLSIAALLPVSITLLNAQGFGFLPLDSPPVQFVITPTADSRVVVAWIQDGASSDSILTEEYRGGFPKLPAPQEVYTTTRRLFSLKLEANEEDDHFLCLTEGFGNSYTTRLLRFDQDFVEEERLHWNAVSSFSTPGRMLGPDNRLMIGSSMDSAFGRFVDGKPLSSELPFYIQEAGYDPTPDNPDYGDDTVTIPVVGLDSAIEDDGSVSASFFINRLRLKRFNANKSIDSIVLLDTPSFSTNYKTPRSALAVNASKTTLLAWQWNEFNFAGLQVVNLKSTHYFRAVFADDSKTDTVTLTPASTISDLNDRPTVGIRPDGSGAIAWTVRTADGTSVWIQRLDTNLHAFEPSRRVDARPGYLTDLPMIQRDRSGKLYLGWRCTPINGEGAEIGLLELDQLDQALTPPKVTPASNAVRIDWECRPASETMLFHSPDLNREGTTPLHSTSSISGPTSFEHETSAKSGFYWLQSD